jgi:hypothetical protein
MYCHGHPGGVDHDLSVSCVMRKYESEVEVVVVKQERNLKGSLLMEGLMMKIMMTMVVFFVAVHQ